MTKSKKPAPKPVAKNKPKVVAKPAAKPAPAGKKPAASASVTAKAPAKPVAIAPHVTEPDAAAKAIMLNARKRKSTPAIFKIRSRRNTPIVFTLDDVRELIKSRKQEKEKPARKGDSKHGLPVARPGEKSATAKGKTPAPMPVKPHKAKVLGAASLADILGVVAPPKTQKAISVTQMMDQENIAQKYRRYYRQLVELREEIRQGLDMHTQETLKRSAKEDSGDLSGYSQHMADAGTDTFDRDFALSLVSSEQELLFEIEEALKRIRNGTYGICEITGQQISADRLAAVPFTRYSLEGQKELEKQRRYGQQRTGAGGLFAEATGEDAAALAEDDSDAS